MNMKIVIAILAVAVAGLGIAFYVVKNQDDQQHLADTTSISSLSNQLVSTSADLDSAKQVNLVLTNDLVQSRQQSVDFSNKLVATTADLTAQIETGKASLATAETKITGLNSRVSELEAQNTALDRQAAELTNTIVALTAQIGDVRQQLSSARTDKAFLERQLEQLLVQKAELEHKFSDLATVRAQLKKLATEKFITNRIKLDRDTQPTDGKKPAELMIQRTSASAGSGAKLPPHYNLNVEVGSDGSVHVISPPPAAASH